MAFLAVQLGHFYMGGMGEENIVRLPGIDKPGDVLIFLF